MFTFPNELGFPDQVKICQFQQDFITAVREMEAGQIITLPINYADMAHITGSICYALSKTGQRVAIETEYGRGLPHIKDELKASFSPDDLEYAEDTLTYFRQMAHFLESKVLRGSGLTIENFNFYYEQDASESEFTELHEDHALVFIFAIGSGTIIEINGQKIQLPAPSLTAFDGHLSHAGCGDQGMRAVAVYFADRPKNWPVLAEQYA